MRVEHLFEMALDLLADLKATKMVQHFEELTAALQNQVNGPNPDHQNAISKKLQEIGGAARGSRVNRYPASWRDELVQLELADLFGNALDERVQEIFRRNQITHNVALDETNAIKKRLVDTTQNLTGLTAALRFFQFDAEELEPTSTNSPLLFREPRWTTNSGIYPSNSVG